MLTQSHQHAVMQPLPHSCSLPVPQPPPACHAAAEAQGLGEVFPWDACLQHEQDAVKGGLIAHGELACPAFGGRCEDRDEGLQLQPQCFTNGSSCHEGMKHNCFMLISR